MKKALLSVVVILVLLFSVCALADQQTFDSPRYEALGLSYQESGSIQAAAALFADYCDEFDCGVSDTLGASAFTYLYQNEYTAYFCYYLKDSTMLYIMVNPPMLRGGITINGPLSAGVSGSAKWNESTAKSTVHKSLEGSLKSNADVKLVSSSFLSASKLTLAIIKLPAKAEAEEAGAGAEDSVTGKWYNIKGTDVYTLEDSGLGYHDTVPITYTYSDGKVAIMENITDLFPATYTVDLSAGFVRLIPADQSTYYAREADYNRLSTVAREQTTRILTSVDFWSAKNAINYIQFFENGSGWFLLQGETDELSWEFVDNDTIRMSVTTSAGAYSMVVNVASVNGAYCLTDELDQVKYTQKK